MLRLFLLLVLVLVVSTPVNAVRRRSRQTYYRRVMPTAPMTPRQVVTSAAQSFGRGQDTSMQAWAESEANMMANRRHKGHVRSAPNGTFVGVGFSMNGQVVTCVGRGHLVAQATVRGTDGFYHVRVWR